MREFDRVHSNTLIMNEACGEEGKMSKLSKETKIDEVLRVIYSSKSKTTLTKIKSRL